MATLDYRLRDFRLDDVRFVGFFKAFAAAIIYSVGFGYICLCRYDSDFTSDKFLSNGFQTVFANVAYTAFLG
jgi:hypothetical protein